MTPLFPHASSDTRVAVLPCDVYQRQRIKDVISHATSHLQLKSFKNIQVLIKPNCISAGPKGALACTHPEFVAACAEWLVDMGARVTVGDSPAFGSGMTVMEKTGMVAALSGLPVSFARFETGKKVRLSGGVRVVMATDVLEAEYVINLPKLKAHSQLYMTMGVKNLFGAVIGMRKPWLHMRYGRDHRFVEMITDLLYQVPDGVTICDGIVAMERDGPLGGDPVGTGIIALSRNPVALDTALLLLLGLEPGKSPIWRHCYINRLGGSDPHSLIYPFQGLATMGTLPFSAPKTLKPIVFQPHRGLFSIVRRFFLLCRGDR